MDRRLFLQYAGTAALAGPALFTGCQSSQTATRTTPEINATNIPMWKGFNLTALFNPARKTRFDELDFELMAGWGFNYARLPMSYWCWSSPDDWMNIDASVFDIVDEAIRFGKAYNIHVCLNLHRIPGYCINGRDREPKDLFEGPPEDRADALKAAVHHWQFIAERYKGIPNTQLSFDLINEPPNISDDAYRAVVLPLCEAIRKADPTRLIVADGLNVGNTPVPGIVDLNLVQSLRGYTPMQITHYQASWVFRNVEMPVPTWPLTLENGETWDKNRLHNHFTLWRELEQSGVKVHAGEWGVYNKTPHQVALGFMRDQLALWKSYGWGWAVWNFRGDFGILNSGRSDVNYEDYKGLKLDRKMLEILLEDLS